MTRSRRAQLNSKMAEVEEEVRAAGIMRDYAKLAAPFAGVVITKTVEPGNLATPGAPLLTIEQDGLYRLEASVDESKLASVTRWPGGGSRDRGVWPQSECARFRNRPVGGPRLTHLYREAGSSAPRRNCAPACLDGPSSRWAWQKVVAIPLAALMEHGQLQSVFVVEDGLAHTRLVTTGRRAGDAVEVLSGLNAGEKIVLPVPAGVAGWRQGGGPAMSAARPPGSRGARRSGVDLFQTDASFDLRGAARRGALRCGNCRAKRSRRSSCR